MTSEQINEFVFKGKFPESICKPELVETHISWVVLCDQFVYKIKKPIQYSFLDFSTLEKRKFYCQREVELNRRLTEDIYLGVVPVKKAGDCFLTGNGDGEIIDYAVKMNKQDRSRQMDFLLINGKVTDMDMQKLALKIAVFHRRANIIYQKDFLDVEQKFNDLNKEKEFVRDSISEVCAGIIANAIKLSDAFIKNNKSLLYCRLMSGFFRDCHGDLHSKNIFLLSTPQPFDCIEFNDDLRQIDVLNEIAFLCMDLEAFGRNDLADLFLVHYNDIFPAIKTDQDRQLFIYYKSYRANIRAKVNSLRAKSARTDNEKTSALRETEKYLRLMDGYVNSLQT